MNEKKRQKINNGKMAYSAKECAYLAAFVALVIALQLALSFVPGVELVTVSFITYSFVMGARRGMIAATAFSLLRQLVFGFQPVVLILYLTYFNLLTLGFGLLGKKMKPKPKNIVWFVVFACLGTVCFTMIDNILTPVWYGYTARAAKAYFFASLTFMVPQVICSAVSVACLFFPLTKVFYMVKRTLVIKASAHKSQALEK